MAIDYEVEYNNRARVPEHPQIFARWARDGAAYRDEAGKEGRAEIGLKYGPIAAPDHRPVQAARRQTTATARSRCSFMAATGARSSLRASARWRAA